ncbi:MAG: DUF3098 domain-containing protein [Bacteroidetes bacterium]|nr:DUF3098 domain-containing protein [Bacteroidota bacterium]
MDKKPTQTKTPVTAKPARSEEQTVKPANVGEFAFGKENYQLMLIGLAIIVAGFLLMVGGGSTDPNKFNPEIFSFRRITLAPILILTGYVIEIFAIMKRPKD